MVEDPEPKRLGWLFVKEYPQPVRERDASKQRTAKIRDAEDNVGNVIPRFLCCYLCQKKKKLVGSDMYKQCDTNLIIDSR
jgi:hypothetical protein